MLSMLSMVPCNLIDVGPYRSSGVTGTGIFSSSCGGNAKTGKIGIPPHAGKGNRRNLTITILENILTFVG